MGENKCQGCPNYKKNEYTGWMQCYGDKCETEIREDERRKFAGWLQENVIIDAESGVTVVAEVEYTRVISFIELLEMYEKEQKGETE